MYAYYVYVCSCFDARRVGMCYSLSDTPTRRSDKAAEGLGTPSYPVAQEAGRVRGQKNAQKGQNFRVATKPQPPQLLPVLELIVSNSGIGVQVSQHVSSPNDDVVRTEEACYILCTHTVYAQAY